MKRHTSLAATRTVRAALPGIIERDGIGSMLDIPCGDDNWMRTVDLVRVAYIVVALGPLHLHLAGVGASLTGRHCRAPAFSGCGPDLRG